MVIYSTKKVSTENTETIQFSIRIPKKLNKLLQELAQKTGITKNAIITTTLWDRVN